MRIFITIISCWFFFNSAFAIEFEIKVLDKNGPVAFANVMISEDMANSSTNMEGVCIFSNLKPGWKNITISCVGYETYRETFELKLSTNKTVELKSFIETLDEAVITGEMEALMVSKSPMKIEVASSKFLAANPSSSVIESLNYVNGVQEVVSCGVCGTNDIRINGLEGPYTLVLIDGMPIMSSLATVYGFNGIPNCMIKQVEIIKGPSSTLYGTESIAGVINVITKDPEEMSPYSIDMFSTSHGEFNIDFDVSPRVSRRVSTTLGSNIFFNQTAIDQNHDGFMDVPLTKRLSIYNSWKFIHNDQSESRLSGRYYQEERYGGTMGFKPEHAGGKEFYGEYIETQRGEIIGKTNFSNPRIQLNYSLNTHHQNSAYGLTHFNAEQQVAYAALQWNKKIKKHALTSGLTYRFNRYTDNSLVSSDMLQSIPGGFIQDNVQLFEKWSMLTGVRIDHQAEHGWIVSPRINIKFSPSQYSTFRLNAGTGFRVVNLFTEDHASLTGSRQVLINEELKPESSVNLTLNYNQLYTLGNRIYGSFDVDVFITRFENKIIPDYETDPNLIIYSNLKDYGVSRGISMNYSLNFEESTDLRIGATLLDVYEVRKNEEGNLKIPQLLAPKWSISPGGSYKEKRTKLTFDYTAKIMGPMRMPSYPAPFSRPEVSPIYAIHNIKLSRPITRGLTFYVAIKNALNYTQQSPLIDPDHPFEDSFDTSYVYGPLQGRRFMFGFSFHPSKRTKHQIAD